MPDRTVSRPFALGLLCLALCMAPAHAQFSEAGYDHAVSTLRCDCGCHPQSLKDCACGYAAGKRREIRAQMIEEDMTGESLVAMWVDQHGDQILISPPKRGFNLVAWLGPLAALVVALALMAWLLVRWRSRPLEEEAAAATPAPAPNDPYMARLKQQLEEFE